MSSVRDGVREGRELQQVFCYEEEGETGELDLEEQKER